MHFRIAAVITVLPLLVAAAPRAADNFITVPLTKHSDMVDHDGVVDIAALNAHVDKAIAKIHRGFANYAQNTGTVHPIANNLQRRGSGHVPTTESGRRVWQGSIAVGTPPVNYIVVPDTGSADLVLPGPDCGTSCVGHNLYSPSLSWTANFLNRNFKVGYIDRTTMTGDLYNDTVHIAGLAATMQTFGAATEYSAQLNSSLFRPDGVMGMAFGSTSRFGARPVPESLMAQGKLDAPLFAFKLAPNGSYSELCIGCINPKFYSGNFSYAPVTTERYWEVIMDGLYANKLTVPKTGAIIDTAMSVIMGNPYDVNRLYRWINGKPYGNGFYTFPCDTSPEISLSFGGTTFPISNSSFNLGPPVAGSRDCIGGIVGIPGLPAWLIGGVFLTNVYSVFDLGNKRVGFATLA